ncbi:MAG TPA: hypothetical protein VL944_02880 [Candidatus Acidoferrum sp.]|nr:hypothetical protein [Candidatus Acidoferrum sp.]
MEVSILSDTNNAVMNRREISFSIVQDDRTTSKEEIKKEVCKKLGLSPDTTIVVEIKQEFGVRRSTGRAHSYKSKELLEKEEPKYLLERLAKKEKKEAAPEEKKEEKPKAEAKKPKEEAEKEEAKQ